MIRKQTKVWTTRDGRKVRVCDMDDVHLENTIRMLNRVANFRKDDTILSAMAVESTLQGEMALLCIEQDIARTEDADPSEFLERPDLYEALLLERERRKEKSQRQVLPWH